MGDELFTRDEVLGGLPTSRARTLLFLIESRAAHLTAKSRRAMEPAVGEAATKQRDLAFVEAFALGREPPVRPSIQDIERHSETWVDMVPENSRLRAALAHAFAQKYRLHPKHVGGIRAALKLDSESVRREYEQMYGQPISSIYSGSLKPLDRVRWAFSALSRRLESLPPFWTAFSLSLTETVGGGILALPIAVAALGPVPGLILLVVFGLSTMITLVAITEAITRSGPVRYGDAFFGRIVSQYLGKPATAIPTVTLAFMLSLVLTAYYVGVATTLTHVLPIPAIAVAAVLFAIGLYLVSRPSLNATVSTALLVGFINVILILLMVAIALPHITGSNLAYQSVPFVQGRPFRASVVALLFGIMLSAYFGHLSVGNCARVVLKRDSSGRSLIWGGMAAQAAAIVLYCLWVFAVNGSLSHYSLSSATSTALVPLANRAGLGIVIVGSIFVVLAMGMGTVNYSLALHNLALEWLPSRSNPVVLLTVDQGRIVVPIRRKAEELLSIRFAGADAKGNHFVLELAGAGGAERVDATVTDHCDVNSVMRGSAKDIKVSFDILDAMPEQARIRITSEGIPKYEGDWMAAAPAMGEILEAAAPDRKVLQFLMRAGPSTAADIAEADSGSEEQVREHLEMLIKNRSVETVANAGEVRYQARLGKKRGRDLPDSVWSKLLPQDSVVAGQQPHPRANPILALRRELMGQIERRRQLISFVPVTAIFLATEFLLLKGAISFAAPLSVVGIIGVTVLAGIYPLLLLKASRHKGEYVPKLVLRFLGYPPIAISLYLFFLGNLIVYGLIIWQNPVQRIIALAVALAVLGLTVVLIRVGTFSGRIVFELRQEAKGNEGAFSVVANGHLTPVHLDLSYGRTTEAREAAQGTIPSFANLAAFTFEIPRGAETEMEVWAHRVTDTGESEPLHVEVEMNAGTGTAQRIQLLEGQAVLPCPSEGGSVKLTLPAAKMAEERPPSVLEKLTF